MSTTTLFHSGQILTMGGRMKDGWLLVESGRIADIGSEAPPDTTGERIDLAGAHTGARHGRHSHARRVAARHDGRDHRRAAHHRAIRRIPRRDGHAGHNHGRQHTRYSERP